MVVMTALQRGIVNENTVLNVPFHTELTATKLKDVARYSESPTPDRGSTEVE